MKRSPRRLRGSVADAGFEKVAGHGKAEKAARRRRRRRSEGDGEGCAGEAGSSREGWYCGRRRQSRQQLRTARHHPNEQHPRSASMWGRMNLRSHENDGSPEACSRTGGPAPKTSGNGSCRVPAPGSLAFTLQNCVGNQAVRRIIAPPSRTSGDYGARFKLTTRRR